MRENFTSERKSAISNHTRLFQMPIQMEKRAKNR